MRFIRRIEELSYLATKGHDIWASSESFMDHVFNGISDEELSTGQTLMQRGRCLIDMTGRTTGIQWNTVRPLSIPGTLLRTSPNAASSMFDILLITHHGSLGHASVGCEKTIEEGQRLQI